MDFIEFSLKIIDKRIKILNDHCSITKNIYKLSKIFILFDFITNIQKECLKNTKNLFKFNDLQKITKNYEKSFLMPQFGYRKHCKFNKDNAIFCNTSFKILFANYFMISDMIMNLTSKQRKCFYRLDSYMKSCYNYDKKTIINYNEHSYKDYLKTFQNGIYLLIAYNSYIKNSEIQKIITFVAFQMGLTNDSDWKSWEDIYEYCKEDCFGFVIDTHEIYLNTLNNIKSSFYDVPQYFEDAFLTFDIFESFLNNFFNETF